MAELHIPKGEIYFKSVVQQEGSMYFLMCSYSDRQRYLGIIGDQQGFSGVKNEHSEILFCPLSAENAKVLRERLSWLNPVALGSQASFGFGDRMGTATVGHIRALRESGAVGQIAPIFAQQSVRENTRLGRTPQQVMDAATWGIFEAGWREAWGADADHVKDIAALSPFIAAGYSFYTIDPSDHVDNDAETDSLDTLQAKAAQLPWDALQTTYALIQAHYCQQPHQMEDLTLDFTEEILLRALVKYGKALVHTVNIAQALQTQLGGRAFDLEMSVDETDTPTSTHEHFFIANELIKRQLPVVSLAPRFVGKFQKGVDYIGDLALFESEFAKHAAIMRHFGTYKLSIHTGSDKFSLYPIIAKHAQVHVKTAGTSYLVALGVVAKVAPALFRRIVDFARPHFEKDRKSYFLDAKLENVPALDAVSDSDLIKLPLHFDTRQVLHVTFGSILTEFGQEIAGLLIEHQATYEQALSQHFEAHLEPFVARKHGVA